MAVNQERVMLARITGRRNVVLLAPGTRKDKKRVFEWNGIANQKSRAISKDTRRVEGKRLQVRFTQPAFTFDGRGETLELHPEGEFSTRWLEVDPQIVRRLKLGEFLSSGS